MYLVRRAAADSAAPDFSLAEGPARGIPLQGMNPAPLDSAARFMGGMLLAPPDIDNTSVFQLDTFTAGILVLTPRIAQQAETGEKQRQAENLPHGQPAAVEVAHLRVWHAEEFHRDAGKRVPDGEQTGHRAQGAGLAGIRPEYKKEQQSFQPGFIELGGVARQFPRARGKPWPTPRR